MVVFDITTRRSWREKSSSHVWQDIKRGLKPTDRVHVECVKRIVKQNKKNDIMCYPLQYLVSTKGIGETTAFLIALRTLT